MEYMLSIFTDDPDSEDIYHKDRDCSVGVAMCRPISIKASVLRNIKRQAETQIEKVLCYQYEKTSPEYVTHYIDLDAVWKYEDGTRTSLAKKVYAAYKDDFEGYQRYKAVLTPIESDKNPMNIQELWENDTITMHSFVSRLSYLNDTDLEYFISNAGERTLYALICAREGIGDGEVVPDDLYNSIQDMTIPEMQGEVRDYIRSERDNNQ